MLCNKDKVYNPVSLYAATSEVRVLTRITPKDYDFEQHKELVGMQLGDVEVTYADVEELEKDFGFRPSTSLREGLRKFAQWYKEYQTL